MQTYVVPKGATPADQVDYAQIIAIHSALFATGKIAYFSGDQHDPGHFAHGLFDSARQFDCESSAITPCAPSPSITDLFCCGHAFLGDGRLLIAGGTARFNGFEGSSAAWIFDPATASFTQTASMADGRWYPTLVTLGNGDVLAVSGLNANGSDQNRQLEIFSPSGTSGTWTVYGVVSDPFGTLYPRLHLLPTGQVFFVTPIGTQCATWTPSSATPQPLCGPPTGSPTAGFSSYTSVLLPFLPEEHYAAKVLVVNLAQPRILDLTTASPAWADTGPRDVPLDGVITNTTPLRINGCAVILPTGEVLSCGGEEEGGSEVNPVHALEIYRPMTNSWVTLPVATTVNRNYHSVALLLPDGRVWMAGSDKGCQWSFHNPGDYPNGEPTDLQEVKTTNGIATPVDNRELRIEIFEPWYVGRLDRPQFTLGSETVSVGGTFTLTFAAPTSVSGVALIRAGTCTHAFDGDQRFVGLSFGQSGSVLTAHVPDNENLLPPGSYLAFVTAQVVDPGTGATLDVPSKGSWIRIGNSKHVKEIKPELEHIVVKLEDEHIRPFGKSVAEVNDPRQGLVDPTIAVLTTVALSIDNLERQVATLRPFISESERPLVGGVASAISAVPVNPISPELMVEQMTMPMQGMVAAPMQGMATAVNATCPWSGKPVSADALLSYLGQTVGFCTTMHRDQFQAALNHFEAEKSANPQDKTCPWSGNPVQLDALMVHNGQIVGFCSPEHRDSFAHAVEHFVDPPTAG